jgi:hypothetical protein
LIDLSALVASFVGQTALSQIVRSQHPDAAVLDVDLAAACNRHKMTLAFVLPILFIKANGESFSQGSNLRIFKDWTSCAHGARRTLGATVITFKRAWLISDLQSRSARKKGGLSGPKRQSSTRCKISLSLSEVRMSHIYKLNADVRHLSRGPQGRMTSDEPTVYTVIQHMPIEADGRIRYRIRSNTGKIDRVVTEEELSSLC